MKDFEALVQEANQQAFAGWDFPYLNGRMVESRVSWDYRKRVLEAVARATSLLDMGTGGGEFLSSLPRLPTNTCATEAYQQTYPWLRKGLHP